MEGATTEENGRSRTHRTPAPSSRVPPRASPERSAETSLRASGMRLEFLGGSRLRLLRCGLPLLLVSVLARVLVTGVKAVRSPGCLLWSAETPTTETDNGDR
jgi:hypothetical protein